MGAPVDGHGVYEGGASAYPSAGQASWGPRLQQIAAGGFKVVINYGSLIGHMADLQAYIAYAYSLGLRCLIALEASYIWGPSPSYASVYPQMYADAGQPATGLQFTQWIMSQLNTNPGVYGWYIGDEIAQADATNWQPYADGLAAYRNGLPRVVIEGGGPSTASCFWKGTSIALGHCEMGGDDIYPVGYAIANPPFGTIAQIASGIQATATANSIKSIIALQAFAWSQYAPPNRSALMPFPTVQQMYQMHESATANMTPQLVLWYSYFNAIDPDTAPASFWHSVVMAANQLQGAWV